MLFFLTFYFILVYGRLTGNVTIVSCEQQRGSAILKQLFVIFILYLIIWLGQVLVAMWDLVPQPGIKPRPLHWGGGLAWGRELGVLAARPPRCP